MSSRAKSVGIATLVVAIATVIALPLRALLQPVNLAMVYLLGVVAVAVRSGRLTTVLATLGGVAAFDFFCVPPYYTFAVSDSEYVITFAAMLSVALVLSSQTERIKDHASEAAAREARTGALLRLSDRLAGETRVFDAAQAAARWTAEAISATVVIFLPENGRMSFKRRTSDVLPLPASEETIAEWTFNHGRKAGLGVDDLLKATAQYVPLRGTRGVIGVMAVLPQTLASLREHEVLIDLFAHQTALALERTQSHSAIESSRLRMQTEQMRSSLLSAVSHDLRTPLATISGAASTLRESGNRLSEQTRTELLDSISEESERLGRLVANLLDMTRFESGSVNLTRDACPLEEITGAALHRLETELRGREVNVNVPHDLPLVFVDEVLVGHVFVNILENALKYTPSGSPIEITARKEGDAISVEVRDHGPGFEAGEEDRIFDKFYRSKPASSRGAGLGLAIARAVVEAHGGHIQAFNHPQAGAVFRFDLPAQNLPVVQPT